MHFTWIGNSFNDCQSTDVTSINGECRLITVSQNGSRMETTSSLTASLGLTFSELKCGCGYLTSCDINSNVETGHLLTLTYHQCIVIKNHENDNMNGEYKLTSFFKNNKPTYKNSNKSKIYFTDSNFVLESFDGTVNKQINLNSLIDFKKEEISESPKEIIEYYEITSKRNREQLISEFGYTIFFKDENSKLKHRIDIWGDPCPPYQIMIYDKDYCAINMVCCRKLKNYEKDYLYYSYDNNNFIGKLIKKSSDYQVILKKID